MRKSIFHILPIILTIICAVNFSNAENIIIENQNLNGQLKAGQIIQPYDRCESVIELFYEDMGRNLIITYFEKDFVALLFLIGNDSCMSDGRKIPADKVKIKLFLMIFPNIF